MDLLMVCESASLSGFTQTALEKNYSIPTGDPPIIMILSWQNLHLLEWRVRWGVGGGNGGGTTEGRVGGEEKVYCQFEEQAMAHEQEAEVLEVRRVCLSLWGGTQSWYSDVVLSHSDLHAIHLTVLRPMAPGCFLKSERLLDISYFCISFAFIFIKNDKI